MTDSENDDEDWYDDDDELDGEESIACPECGAAMYDYVDKCPKCGYWLTDADLRQVGRGAHRPAWQKITAAGILLVFLLCLLLAGVMIF